ncbi:MAG: DUF2339 domain-containing protein [Nitrospinaceae bacterium]
MDQEEQKKQNDRIEKIEALLFDLANRVNQIDDQLKPTPTPQPGIYSPPGYAIITPQPLSPPMDSDDDEFEYSQKPDPDKEVSQGEFWLNKIGIILLLLGLGFLFKYSVDQDWVTPLVRVSFGLVLGIGLIGFGMRLPQSKRVLSQVLMGGGIAAFYITGYAAFHLYHLIPHYLAFSFMVGVTLLSYYLALYQNEPPMALVAVIGGMGTPFILNTGSGNIPGLVLYTCVVLTGSMAIYYFRPWRLLYWSSWIGGWIVMGIAVNQLPPLKPESLSYFWSVQAGILFAWTLFWIVPMVQKKGQWKPSVAGGLPQPKTIFESLTQDHNLHITFQMVFSALFSFNMSKLVWNLTDIQWGGIVLWTSLIFFLIAFFTWWLKKPHELVALHALVSTLFLTIALFYLLDKHELFLAYGLEATALHYLSHRTREPVINFAAIWLFVGIGVWFVARLFGKVDGDPIFNLQALADLVMISLAVYSSTHIDIKQVSKIYILVAYLALLAWFLRELGGLPDGNGLVSITWGLTGSILLWVGLRKSQLDIFKAGFATLVLVAIKLLIVDLANLNVIWRILVFMGFGGAFLFLSYWMKDLWNMKTPNKTA